MIKVLNRDTVAFKEFESISKFLEDLNIEIHQTTYNGMIFKRGEEYFKYVSEGSPSDQLPIFFEGRYILCDNNGNTDFYND